MDLTIVIPVLDEEGSVGRVARECLAARDAIRAETGVEAVHVVVVSDGSTDRSAEIAQSIGEVTTVVFERNRGYGAAIQAGWLARPADLLGFLDGDGTCSPAFFVPLVQALEEQGADVVLGSRMGPGSEMPRLRQVGNWLFALLLGLLSRTRITDAASGMRVLRRSALPRLGPLPSGLHFTPAMSARAVMGGLRIVEVPMPYRERVGESKLRVVRDGLRFLRVILAATLYLRPSRLALPLVASIALVCAIAMALPVRHYLVHRSLEEWMIYRFLLAGLLANVGVLVFCSTLLAEHAIALGLLRYGAFAGAAPWWWSRRGLKVYLAAAGAALALGVVLVLPGLRSWLATGRISFEQMHWSRVVLAAFAGLTFLQVLLTLLLVRLIDALNVGQGLLLDAKPD